MHKIRKIVHFVFKVFKLCYGFTHYRDPATKAKHVFIIRLCSFTVFFWMDENELCRLTTLMMQHENTMINHSPHISS
jgi:hypothetical protein